MMYRFQTFILLLEWGIFWHCKSCENIQKWCASSSPLLLCQDGWRTNFVKNLDTLKINFGSQSGLHRIYFWSTWHQAFILLGRQVHAIFPFSEFFVSRYRFKYMAIDSTVMFMYLWFSSLYFSNHSGSWTLAWASCMTLNIFSKVT